LKRGGGGIWLPLAGWPDPHWKSFALAHADRIDDMDSARERLVACFTAVFPGLAPDDAPSSTIDTVAGWDSSRHFMLMQVIEETFGIRIPEEVVGEIDSFAGFEDYLAGLSKVS
jgi:acyl carrier protein